MSLDRFTPFFWNENRIGNLTPLAMMWVRSPYANLILQTLLYTSGPILCFASMNRFCGAPEEVKLRAALRLQLAILIAFLAVGLNTQTYQVLFLNDPMLLSVFLYLIALNAGAADRKLRWRGVTAVAAAELPRRMALHRKRRLRARRAGAVIFTSRLEAKLAGAARHLHRRRHRHRAARADLESFLSRPSLHRPPIASRGVLHFHSHDGIRLHLDVPGRGCRRSRACWFRRPSNFENALKIRPLDKPAFPGALRRMLRSRRGNVPVPMAALKPLPSSLLRRTRRRPDHAGFLGRGGSGAQGHGTMEDVAIFPRGFIPRRSRRHQRPRHRPLRLPLVRAGEGVARLRDRHGPRFHSRSGLHPPHRIVLERLDASLRFQRLIPRSPFMGRRQSRRANPR